MGFKVMIRQSGGSIDVPPGQTILVAALKQRIPYPHGCASGNCGACKSRLEAGEVEMKPHSAFALSAAEASDGLILACRSLPKSDVVVAWLDK